MSPRACVVAIIVRCQSDKNKIATCSCQWDIYLPTSTDEAVTLKGFLQWSSSSSSSSAFDGTSFEFNDVILRSAAINDSYWNEIYFANFVNIKGCSSYILVISLCFLKVSSTFNSIESSSNDCFKDLPDTNSSAVIISQSSFIVVKQRTYVQSTNNHIFSLK